MSRNGGRIAFQAPPDRRWRSSLLFVAGTGGPHRLPLGCILPTPDAPGQRAFSRRAASFFLEIRQYSCKKMSCAARKFLAAGHIMSWKNTPYNQAGRLKTRRRSSNGDTCTLWMNAFAHHGLELYHSASVKSMQQTAKNPPSGARKKVQKGD